MLNLDTSLILNSIIDDVNICREDSFNVSLTVSELTALTNVAYYVYNAFVDLEEHLEREGKSFTKAVTSFVDNLDSAFNKLNSI